MKRKFLGWVIVIPVAICAVAFMISNSHTPNFGPNRSSEKSTTNSNAVDSNSSDGGPGITDFTVNADVYNDMVDLFLKAYDDQDVIDGLADLNKAEAIKDKQHTVNDQTLIQDGQNIVNDLSGYVPPATPNNPTPVPSTWYDMSILANDLEIYSPENGKQADFCLAEFQQFLSQEPNSQSQDCPGSIPMQ
ncbi:hypothetical protein GCM10025857_31680 [Alicyclobacillus contaminans]|uniref:hypothetical protein n=1 Tax=Alicyclobacillus contaminans TaxID=392016 RepID=UPI0012EC1911|nr:hypothetical protein [Alicyclobacillus contaminans]GMA51811.1 hypothetical protein GCM10025857_31680 [Alicyclobacillus contaminans]